MNVVVRPLDTTRVDEHGGNGGASSAGIGFFQKRRSGRDILRALKSGEP